MTDLFRILVVIFLALHGVGHPIAALHGTRLRRQ